ncbi:MAG: serine/threonine protein kinase [Planctomycetes bacterium]|nr:serine/threonine protein kinase [Planctomycetota bacterium]
MTRSRHRDTLAPLGSKRKWIFPSWRAKIGPGAKVRSAGSYQVGRLLGKGGMGRVYLVEKLGVHGFSKLMAMKVLPKHGLGPVAARMFLDEARLTGGLTHPNIVQVNTLGETRYEYFIIMEHVFGVTLLEFIERHEELGIAVPVNFGCYLIARVLNGLHYAHNKHDREGQHLGIVHRDICPSNIMLSFRGIPKLTDFGVAKAKMSHVEDETDVVFGKYPYMAPEQVQRLGTDPRSDLYSLGLVMYELFTGKLVHEVGDTAMLIDEFENKDIPAPRELEPSLPVDLSDVIVKAISLKIEDRFRSAKQMRQELETFLLKNFMFPSQEDLADYLCELFPQAAKHRWW